MTENLPDIGDRVLTIKEVAIYLQLCNGAIYRLAQRGQLPGRRVGRVWRFSRIAIDRWLESAEHGKG